MSAGVLVMKLVKSLLATTTNMTYWRNGRKHWTHLEGKGVYICRENAVGVAAVNVRGTDASGVVNCIVNCIVNYIVVDIGDLCRIRRKGGGSISGGSS